MATTAIHLVLIVKLVQGSGSERVSVVTGPWLVAVGLLTMAAAGWLLVGDASRYRARAGNAAPTELHSTPQGPEPW